jgi:allophanate hydrolase subunit 2
LSTYRSIGRATEELLDDMVLAVASGRNRTYPAPYLTGSIQIPGGIEPIVLHRDAVSGGGYVMVAVIGADMDLVGQSPQNVTTRFIDVDLDTPLQARRDYMGPIDRLTELLPADPTVVRMTQRHFAIGRVLTNPRCS